MAHILPIGVIVFFCVLLPLALCGCLRRLVLVYTLDSVGLPLLLEECIVQL